jgi:hypothetical protein
MQGMLKVLSAAGDKLAESCRFQGALARLMFKPSCSEASGSIPSSHPDAIGFT